ncbi:MAG: 16S rRNA (adenine(1518)-N(6)/adenine(1519)-N(6))-dimethyltransferase RsmA [Candidatus Parcubacteria bacterium]|nr:16S rRNA (adenine(1518)-N(6)/adenine(1519)-N(6))-dimethyltransferase RsmA [Candidatus Parcubacteria bacterium]
MSIDEIKKLINDYGLKPSKGKGQNFLIDDNVLAKIMATADLSPEDYVLEIGPGFGVLTQELIKTGKKVLSVELDTRLVFYIKRKFKGVSNWELLEGDILKIKNEQLAEKLGSKKYKLVANLPYAITKPILQKFLSYDPKPREMVILVQKEVAEKIVAKPGEMSILAISVQYYGQPQLINIVSKESFFPVPKVDSAILQIVLRQTDIPAEFSQIFTQIQIQNYQEKRFWQLVKIGFSSPRKQLQNNLANGLKITNAEVKNRLEKAGLQELCRAQDLSLLDWGNIYQQFIA